MKPLRKSIYIFDLLMLGITAVSLFHAGVYRNLVVVAMAWYMLLLRANISFLLWRKERKTIWPIIAFMALFAAGFVFMRYDHVWYRMGRFPSIAVGKALKFDLYPVFVGVFIWVWILPLAAWLWQFFSKKSEKGDSKWPQLAGLALFHDRAGQTFVALSCVALCAYLAGRVMDAELSFVVTLVLVLGTYYSVNHYVGRKAHWLEYALLLVAMFFFNKAQYRIGNERVAFLAVSAALVLSVCVWMLAMTKRVLAALMVFLALAFVVPTVSTGYNVYCCTDSARYRNCKYTTGSVSDDYEDFGLLYTFSKEGYGLRDRYHELLPSKFRRIEPDAKGWKQLICITREGDTLTYDLYMQKYFVQ